MLFISRVVNDGLLGVVDTDDDVETEISVAELADAIDKYGLQVVGVERNKETDLLRYYPMQDPRTCTRKQVKLKTVYDIDIRVYKDEITYLSVGDKDATVRLSDYGHRIDLSYNFLSIGNGELTVVLDDNIDVRVSFDTSVGAKGFIFDIREVSNRQILEEIYSDLTAGSEDDCELWSDYLIDDETRMAVCQSLCVLGGWSSNSEGIMANILDGKNRVEIGRRVAYNMRDRLNELCSYDQLEERCNDRFKVSVFKRLPVGWGLSSPCHEFSAALKRLNEVYNLCMIFKEPDWLTINRLVHYFDFFEPLSEMQEYAMKYLSHLCECARKFCQKEGIAYAVLK